VNEDTGSNNGGRMLDFLGMIETTEEEDTNIDEMTDTDTVMVGKLNKG
jgi:hypothetical protein